MTEGANEKNVVFTNLYVMGLESESVSIASIVSKAVSTGTLSRTPRKNSITNYSKETTWKGKYQSTDNTKIGKERGNSY
jgi:hypothetical protein